MQHWVFDLDNTLVDSFPPFKRDIRELFGSYGVSITDTQLDLAHKYHFTEFLSLYLPTSKVPEAERALIDSSISRVHEVVPYSGIVDFLNQLKERECRLSLWTAREMDSASVILEATGLRPYFSHVVTRTCFPTTKPNPEGLEQIISLTHHSRDVTVMVGDHAMDMQGARSARVHAARVSWGVPAAEDELHLSDQHFRTVEEIKVWAHSFTKAES